MTGGIAYYLIKHKDEIAMFFSLRTGLLFDRHVNESGLSEKLNILKKAISAKEKVDIDPQNEKEALKFLKATRLANMPLNTIRNLYDIYAPKKQVLIKEKQADTNNLLYHVEETYPAIELYIFCNNENFKPVWDKLGFEKCNTMGRVMFWKFIVCKVLEIQKIVGCKFLYLFAADSSDDNTLISYYSLLNFKVNEQLGTTKPYFDWKSKFMCQEINELKNLRNQFFKNFNPEFETIVI